MWNNNESQGRNHFFVDTYSKPVIPLLYNRDSASIFCTREEYCSTVKSKECNYNSKYINGNNMIYKKNTKI